MSSFFNTGAIQMVGDGTELAIVSPGWGSFILDSPIVTNLDIRYSMPQTVCFSDGKTEFIQPNISTAEINLSIIPRSIMQLEDASLIDYDIFSRKTVRELLQVIEKKIGQR